jgi:hypothetical protein
LSAWMTDVRFEPLAGQLGEEGERRLVTLREDSPYQSYVIETIRVTPLQHYVVKVMPQTGSDFFGFADWTFSQLGSKTCIVYTIYNELTVLSMADAEFRRFAQEQYAVTREQVAKNNERLRMLAEAAS